VFAIASTKCSCRIFAFSAFQRGRIIIIGLQQARLEVAVENIEIEIGDKYNYSVYAYCC